MGINAPSLYSAFGSKEQLFREAVERYSSHEGGCTQAELLRAPTVRAGIENMLQAAARTGTQPGKPRGCLIVLGAPTGSDEHSPVRQMLCDSRRHMQAALDAMSALYAENWWAFLLVAIAQIIGTIALLVLLGDNSRSEEHTSDLHSHM